jgi:hypothetical protein
VGRFGFLCEHLYTNQASLLVNFPEETERGDLKSMKKTKKNGLCGVQHHIQEEI